MVLNRHVNGLITAWQFEHQNNFRLVTEIVISNMGLAVFAAEIRGTYCEHMMQYQQRTSGILLLLLAQTFVGVNIVTAKFLITSMPAWLMLDIRFLLASVILLPFHWLTPGRQQSLYEHLKKLSLKDWMYLVLQALSAGVFFNCLMLSGLQSTDANVAGVITSALPAIITVMSWIFLKETMSMQKALCVLFACMGLMVMAYGKLVGGGTHSVAGDMIIFCSLLPEASYYILCKLSENKLPIFLASSLLNGINAVLLLPVLFLTDWQHLHVQIIDWLVLLLIGVSSGLFYVFWFLGTKHVDGIMTALTTAAMPVSVVVLAWLCLHETFSWYEFAGMGLVILSIGLYAKR